MCSNIIIRLKAAKNFTAALRVNMLSKPLEQAGSTSFQQHEGLSVKLTVDLRKVPTKSKIGTGRKDDVVSRLNGST
jgi:hypothetical protein